MSYPLAFLEVGRTGRVVAILGGQSTRTRLISMGLGPGQAVSVLRNDGFGPVVVVMGEGRVALGRGIAQKIVVDESPAVRAGD